MITDRHIPQSSISKQLVPVLPPQQLPAQSIIAVPLHWPEQSKKSSTLSLVHSLLQSITAKPLQSPKQSSTAIPKHSPRQSWSEFAS